MRIAAIIQARMRSTRLPGKVLMPVGGRPVLEHIIRRLKRAWTLTDIAVTTSIEPEDDAIVRFCADAGVPVFRGPEENVLERFAIAARALAPDIIVRVTGDSPLIDPKVVDHLVCEMVRAGADFLALKSGAKCMQEGVDPFSRRALRVLLGEASMDPVAREHVTGWLKAHPERVRVAEIEIDPALMFSGARLSIDTPADLEFFAALARRVDLDTVSLKEIAALLKREPWLLAINAHVRQKAATQRAATVLLRADGGGALGYGHLTRTAALAEALRDGEGLGLVALTGAHPMGDTPAARAFFEARKISVEIVPSAKGEGDLILDIVRRRKVPALVLDVRTDLSPSVLAVLRAEGVKVITIDDATERRLEADVAVYPPVPQAGALDWHGFAGQLLIGAEWILLPGHVARIAAQTRTEAAARLLISMGGSDPMGWTEPIARVCAHAIEAPIDVVIGPGFADAQGLIHRLRSLPNVTTHTAPEKPWEIFAGARLAVATFGVTAYELAALGVPALYIALSEDHRRSAEGAETLGFGKTAAMAQTMNADAIAELASELWADEARLGGMAKAGRAAIDGKGAERLARKIAELIRAQEAAVGAPLAPAQTSRSNRRPAAAG